MFSPQDFLNFSNDLLKCTSLKKNNGCCRSIISRSYYAAFLTAREKFDKLDTMILYHPKHDMHDQVTKALQITKYDLQDEFLSDDLVELRTYRIDADYHFPGACATYERRYRSPKSPELPTTALECYQLAENIITRVNKLH